MNRRAVWAWSFYDFANSAYPTVIVTVAYSVYFKTVVAGEGAGGGAGDFFWGLAISLSMVVVAAAAPFLGSLADVSGTKKRFLGLFAGLCVVFTGLLYFVEAGDLWRGVLLFALANIGFEASLVFYNAFVPEIAEAKDFGKVSGYGWAFGYVGGLLCLFWVFPLIQGGFAPENLSNFRLAFVRVAVFYAVFSIPTFVGLRERAVPGGRAGGWPDHFRRGWKRLRGTFDHVRRLKHLFRFLLAFFLYNDGIVTVIAFSSIYAVGTLGFSVREVTALFIAVQVTAAVGALGFGFVVDRIGAKRTILLLLGLWCAVVLAAFSTETRAQYFAVALVAGLGLGSVQSASRSLMALFIPAGKAGEFYGFYGVCGKLSSVLGPVTFGAVSALAGSQRIAILSVLFFFLAGAGILWSVRVERVEV
ncbi:MAG: MFS transporter [Candidatus Tectomicrobia bacterium]|nr:MFS transporter [Candidatus Tectomicrobia bacterium]